MLLFLFSWALFYVPQLFLNGTYDGLGTSHYVFLMHLSALKDVTHNPVPCEFWKQRDHSPALVHPINICLSKHSGKHLLRVWKHWCLLKNVDIIFACLQDSYADVDHCCSQWSCSLLVKAMVLQSHVDLNCEFSQVSSSIHLWSWQKDALLSPLCSQSPPLFVRKQTEVPVLQRLSATSLMFPAADKLRCSIETAILSKVKLVDKSLSNPCLKN